ncbi:MAG TPA: hypothetical protein VF620_14075 [Allosphingosinicella sp.]
MKPLYERIVNGRPEIAEPLPGVGRRLAMPLSLEAGLDSDLVTGTEAHLGAAADVIGRKPLPTCGWRRSSS